MPEPQGVNVRNKEIEELPWGGKIRILLVYCGWSYRQSLCHCNQKGIMQSMTEGPLTVLIVKTFAFVFTMVKCTQ